MPKLEKEKKTKDRHTQYPTDRDERKEMKRKQQKKEKEVVPRTPPQGIRNIKLYKTRSPSTFSETTPTPTPEKNLVSTPTKITAPSPSKMGHTGSPAIALRHRTLTSGTTDWIEGILEVFKTHYDNMCFIDKNILQYDLTSEPGTIYFGTMHSNITVDNKIFLYVDNLNERKTALDFKIDKSKFKTCCDNTSSRFIVVPLILVFENSSHINLVIIDKNNKTIERFEPHGSKSNSLYKKEEVDGIISDIFKDICGDSIDYSMQEDDYDAIQFSEGDITLPDEIGGYCATWVFLYLHYRLKNPDMPMKDIVNMINNIINYEINTEKYKKIGNERARRLQFIRDYASLMRYKLNFETHLMNLITKMGSLTLGQGAGGKTSRKRRRSNKKTKRSSRRRSFKTSRKRRRSNKKTKRSNRRRSFKASRKRRRSRNS